MLLSSSGKTKITQIMPNPNGTPKSVTGSTHVSNLGNASSSGTSHKVIMTVGAIVVAFILWQYKGTHTYMKGIAAILILGILLRYYPTIHSQFTNLGT